jgi:NADPH2:quinone reductase
MSFKPGARTQVIISFSPDKTGKPDELSALIERGQLRPHVGAAYSLADIPLAHARLESANNGLRGKIAIDVKGAS